MVLVASQRADNKNAYWGGAWLPVQEEEGTPEPHNGEAVYAAGLQGNVEQLMAVSDEDIKRKSQCKATVLHAAAAGDQPRAIMYLVLKRGLDVHDKTTPGETPLVVAARRGCVMAIYALVACGAPVHDEPGEVSKALLMAALHGRVIAMETLVELGADATVVGRFGSVLHFARHSGREAIDCAVRLGADPSAVDEHGRTALHLAALEHEPDLGTLEQLVQAGVPLNAVDDKGLTVLHKSTSNPSLCRKLLMLGADRWVKDETGRTPYDMAARPIEGRFRFSFRVTHVTSKPTKATFLDPEPMTQAEPPASELLQGPALWGFFEQRQTREHRACADVLDTYFPIVPSMVQVCLGMRGPSESSLTRFAAHDLFESKVLSLVNCLLTGKDDKAYEQLTRECVASSTSVMSSPSTAAEPRARQG